MDTTKIAEDQNRRHSLRQLCWPLTILAAGAFALIDSARSASAQSTTAILHDFRQNKTVRAGDDPVGSLTLAADGNFYGVTFAGGAGYEGTLYRMKPDGFVTILHSFDDGTVKNDGRLPDSPPIVGSDGNFYGTVEYGGAKFGGIVYRMTPAGAYSVMYSFDGSSNSTDAYGPESSLVQASDGNFYGTCTVGGPDNDGGVFQMTPAGQVKFLHFFTGGPDGVYPASALVQGADDALYGTTEFGGAGQTSQYTGGTVYKITTDGVETVLHSFADGTVASDGEQPRGNLILGSSGDFYGTTEYGGTSTEGCVYKITPDGQLTKLHSFNDGTVPNDGFSPEAGLFESSDGNFYGTTVNGGTGDSDGTVFRITPGGHETIVHSFGDGSVVDDGYQPRGELVSDSFGNLIGTTIGGGGPEEGDVYKLEVTPPGLYIASVTLMQSTVNEGARVTGLASITTPAPAGGHTINLTGSGSANVSTPASVTIPAGRTSANFTIATRSNTDGTATITAYALGAGHKSVTLTVTKS